MDELIPKIVAFILDHKDVIQTFLKNAVKGAGKIGMEEIGKIAAREGKEKIGELLQKLFSKPSVRKTVLNASQDPEKAAKALSETIEIVLTIEPQLLLMTGQGNVIDNWQGLGQAAAVVIPKINTLKEYLLVLQKQLSNFVVPGIPKFPAGIDIGLSDIYVEQRLTDTFTNKMVQLDYYQQLSRSLWLQDIAGTGKSTAVWRFIDLLSAGGHSDDKPLSRLPVRVNASDLIGIEAPYLNSVLERLKKIYSLSDNLINQMAKYFVDGKAVLLIDSLDEVTSVARAQIVSIIQDIAFTRENQLIIGSRPLHDFSMNISTAKINRFSPHDAYILTSKWQDFFQKHNAIQTKTDDHLNIFKEKVINDIYRINDIRKSIMETPLFLTFLIFYLSSPDALETKNPFQILGNKTLLLSRIVEFVIPYWETQKGYIDIITPIKNEEALSVLFLVAFLAKDMPGITWGQTIKTLEYSQDSLQIDTKTIQRYFESWISTNIIVPSVGTSAISFWHEEIKDFCVARYLFRFKRKGLLTEDIIDEYLNRDDWKVVARYYDNLIRIERQY